jgi:hypothetical protein
MQNRVGETGRLFADSGDRLLTVFGYEGYSGSDYPESAPRPPLDDRLLFSNDGNRELWGPSFGY